MGGVKGMNVAEKNGMWKGDKVGYEAIHAWIKRRLPQPSYCEKCNKESKKLDLANISGKYLRRLDDWEYLCRSCHMESDGRFKNLLKGINDRPKKPCQKCNELTTGFKWCKYCRIVVRREWWKKYNKKKKRAKYRKEYMASYRKISH